MELTQLNQFKVIAEYENMSKAAQKLFVTQPALSRSIKNLERELGVELFDREGKKIKLNKHGEALLECVDDIQKRINILKSEFAKQITSPDIAINSSIYSIANYLLPMFHINNDNVIVKYNLNKQDDTFNLLFSNISDIVFSTEPIEEPGITCVELCRDYAGVSVFHDDNLTKFKHIAADDLRGMTFVCFQSDNPLTVSAKKMMEQYNVIFDYQPSAVAAQLYTKNKNTLTFMTSLSQYLGGLSENRLFIPFDAKNTIFLTYYICYKNNNPKLKTIKYIVKWLEDYIEEYNFLFP